MKRVVTTITIFVFFSSLCPALTYMGPPTSNIRQGQLGLGADYSFSQVDVELSGYDISTTIETEANVFFARLLFGLADNVEFSGRLGFSKIKEDSINDFSTSNEFAWGLGSKVTFSKSDYLDIGLAVQVASFSGDDTWVLGPYSGKMDINIYEFQLAVGPTFKMDNLNFYGGPFLHFITGDFDLANLSYDIEQESELGGYIGLVWNMASITDLAIEYQLTGDAYAIGISLVHRFGENKKTSAKPVSTFGALNYRPPVPQSKSQTKYRIKRDATGEILKDENGNYIFFPVEGNEK